MDDFAPLDDTHQALLHGTPQQGPISYALSAAGINNTYCTPLGGFIVSDVAAAHALIDNESQWLPFAKQARLDQLSAVFTGLNDAGRNYSGKNFQIDDKSLQKFNGQATVAILTNLSAGAWPANFGWIASDNSILPVSSANEMIALASDIGSYIAGLTFANFSLKAALRGAETAVELYAIDINSGWPANP